MQRRSRVPESGVVLLCKGEEPFGGMEVVVLELVFSLKKEGIAR